MNVDRMKIGTKVVAFSVMSFALFVIMVFGIIQYQLSEFTKKEMTQFQVDLMLQKQTTLKNYVELAYRIAESNAQDASLSEEQRIEKAKVELSNMKYDDGTGYFFAYEEKAGQYYFSFHGTKKELWNTVANINEPDVKGFAFRKVLIDNARSNKNDFVEYFYEKPGTKEVIKKLSYAKYFAQWNWIIVTGFYIDDVDKLVAKKQETLKERLWTIRLILGGISVILFLITGTFLWYFIRKYISLPLKNTTEKFDAIANGDLTVTINVETEDEIGKMMQSQKNMVHKVSQIIASVNETANSLIETCEKLSEKSNQLSEGATEQASSVEEISSSMEQMVATIEQSNDLSNKTNSITTSTVNEIRQNAEVTIQAVDSMKEIAKRIVIINDIAFQTNILALNAAVEAARAGEAGRGFSVVAAEVRKLAERSKLTANEIDSVSKKTIDTAENASAQLEHIIPEMEKTASMVQEVAAASIEQKAGANQVNNAITQLNTVTQQNASASEELAQNARELNSKAELLRELICYFKV